MTAMQADTAAPRAPVGRAGLRVADSERADRRVRRALGSLAVIALIASALGLARSAGAFGTRRADDRLVDHATLVAHHTEIRWLWVAVAALALIAAAAALGALRRLVVPQAPARDLDLDYAPDGPRTDIRAAALADLVRAQVEAIEGVDAAAVRFGADGHTLVGWARTDHGADHALIASCVERDIDALVGNLGGQADLRLRLQLRPAG